jgi:hypothetical protein
MHRGDAVQAARVFVGTEWEGQGYSVDPIQVTRQVAGPSTHPDVIE